MVMTTFEKAKHTHRRAAHSPASLAGVLRFILVVQLIIFMLPMGGNS